MPTGIPKAKAAPAEESDTEVIAPKTFEQAKTEQEVARMSRIDEMRDYFKGQKRVRVKVRNDSDVPVQINGYTFIVQANVAVEVPTDVADILEEAGYI